MVNSGAECKVVYKDNGGTNNFLTVFICQEISLDEAVVTILLTIPAHPFAKVYIHALWQKKLGNVTYGYAGKNHVLMA